jgi:hypothetical protein
VIGTTSAPVCAITDSQDDEIEDAGRHGAGRDSVALAMIQPGIWYEVTRCIKDWSGEYFSAYI